MILLTAQLRIGKIWGDLQGDEPMASLDHAVSNPDSAPDSPPPAITKKQITFACFFIYAIGVVGRIVWERYLQSISPRTGDILTGHTYALSGRGGSVYVTLFEARLLECLYIMPWAFLLFGMLVWARAWREWK